MTSEPKDQYGYPCKPRKLDALSWFYEERSGLTIVNEPIDGARSTLIRIPWRKLEAAVARHRAARKR